MQHEEPKRNKELSQQLDTLNHLPEGFRFRQAAVWEKLEAGLPQAPKQRRFRWWYAAAILIGIGISLPFFFSKKEHIKPATTATKTNNQQPSLLLTTADVIATPKQALVVTPSVKRKAQPSLSPLQRTLSTKTMLEDQKIEVATTPLPVLTEPIIATPEPLTVAAPRNRFRIAHSNELRMPHIPAEVLNNASKSTYSSLSRHIKGPTVSEEEPVVETYPQTKKPKTLIGIFNTHQ